MILPTELSTPRKVVARIGSLRDVPRECLTLGSRGMVIYGKALANRRETWDSAVKLAGGGEGIILWEYQGREPTIADVSLALDWAQEMEAQFVCGIGGGSILDTAKATAGLFHALHGPKYYLDGGRLETPGIPFIAVPTTAGTGSEATINAVISNPDTGEKLSIREGCFLARTVVLDGALLAGLPRQIAAQAGMDAFAQGVESFLANQATWYSRTLALKGIEIICRTLFPVFEGGTGEPAADLLLASYIIGLAFASSRLGAVHGLAHPLGVFYDQPHGLVCAACLNPVLSINRTARPTDYEILSRTVGCDLMEFVEQTNNKLNLTNPFKGQVIRNREQIIAATLASGSTKANPKQITRDDVESLLQQIF